MEFHIKIKKEESVEYDQKNIQSQLQLSTSTDLGQLKNEPDNNSAVAVKTDIKEEEFLEGDLRSIESQLTTSVDLEDLKNESGEYNSAVAVKTDIKEEFLEGDSRSIESQLATCVDLEDLKNESDGYNSGSSEDGM
uniref:Uncharacterized protein LOC114327255 n=1 Tax=Diabrotica virgifera virgifera TaxID=50390 RepID=A0A6P7F737_DIAVI